MKKHLIRDFTIACDGDNWSWSMGCFFAVAGEMHYRGLDIPYQWEYSPGAGGDGRDSDSFQTPICADATDDQLKVTGDILYRYTEYLRFKGENY